MKYHFLWHSAYIRSSIENFLRNRANRKWILGRDNCLNFLREIISHCLQLIFCSCVCFSLSNTVSHSFSNFSPFIILWRLQEILKINFCRKVDQIYKFPAQVFKKVDIYVRLQIIFSILMNGFINISVSP